MTLRSRYVGEAVKAAAAKRSTAHEQVCGRVHTVCGHFDWDLPRWCVFFS
jgi:hypothetical protein